MKILLLRRSRVWHEAGEIVEVSPAEAGFLLSTGSATTAPVKKEVPEAALVVEKPECPVLVVETPEQPDPEQKPAKRKRTTKSAT